MWKIIFLPIYKYCIGKILETEMKKLLVFCFFLALLTGCGEKKTSLSPIFHELNVVKKMTDSAMTAINTIRSSIPQIEEAQKEIIKHQQYINFLLSDPTSSRLDDAEVQLAYLTEAFRDLYSQVKEIRLIPFIQQAQKTAPRPSGFTVSTATQTLGGDEYSLYSRGLDAYRKKFYDEARQFMLEIIKSFPNGNYSDRANYWIAESFIEQKSFKQALEFYQRVLGFNGSSKEDDAQYRIGICYLYLGEFDKAVEELKKLVLRYPASEFVGKANDAIEIARQRRIKQDETITVPDIVSFAQEQIDTTTTDVEIKDAQAKTPPNSTAAKVKSKDKNGAKDKKEKDKEKKKK
jgi:TolA-binding protein